MEPLHLPSEGEINAAYHKGIGGGFRAGKIAEQNV